MNVAMRRLRVRGVVQGVGYRWHCVRTAQRLGLAGWVRNRLDGSVEIFACGEELALAQLILWAQSGPPGARVDQVQVEEVADEPAVFEDFHQTATE